MEEKETFRAILVFWDHKEHPEAKKIDRAIQALLAGGATSVRISDFDDESDRYSFTIADRPVSADHQRWIRAHWDLIQDTQHGTEIQVPINVPPAPRAQRRRG